MVNKHVLYMAYVQKKAETVFAHVVFQFFCSDIILLHVNIEVSYNDNGFILMQMV